VVEGGEHGELLINLLLLAAVEVSLDGSLGGKFLYSRKMPYKLAYKPPHVARARQMPSLRRGLIVKGGLYTKCTCMNTCLVIQYFLTKYVYSSSVLTLR
jgi:hypothetical protein